METIQKISVFTIWLFIASIVIVIATAMFLPESSASNDEKNARLACMIETQLQFGNDIVYGNMPSDLAVITDGDGIFTVQLRFNKNTGIESTVVCDVSNDNETYQVASLDVIR